MSPASGWKKKKHKETRENKNREGGKVWWMTINSRKQAQHARKNEKESN